jgi:hypothetical protein
VVSAEFRLPCVDQSSEAIEAWLRTNVRSGTEVVIRHIIGWRVRYQRARVARTVPERITVALRRSDGTYEPPRAFLYSGRSCWNPGSSHLVIPTPAVLSACAACEENGGSLPRPGWTHRTSNDPRRR